MSDEPSDAQKLIAEVIATHRALFDGEACDACDWKFTNEYYGHDEHVAVEVDKALGGLTRVYSVAGDCRLSPGKDCDHFGEHGPWTCEAEAETRAEAEAFPIARQPDAHIESRFVSGWTVTE